MPRVRRKVTVFFTTLLSAATLLTLAVPPASATEPAPRIAEITELAEAVLEFDLSERTAHVAVFELADGRQVQVGAEPVASGLDGTWHVWGDNGAFRMEYYVTYQSIAGTNYTRVLGSPYGLKVVGRGLSWDSERLSVPRAAETASLPCLVEGAARFHYPLIVQTGGVRASVKNASFSASLW